MTYADREEAYRAGRENRTIHTAYPDAYDQGQKDRQRARKRARDSEGAGGGGIVAIMLLAAAAAIVAVALASALGAIAAAFVVMAMARVPPSATSLSYANAYKASFYALATWLVVTSAVGLGAIGIQNGQPGAWYQFVRETARAYEEGGTYVVALALSSPAWPARISVPAAVPPVGLALGALLALGVPAWLGVIVALNVQANFGLLRGLVAAPLVVAAGFGSMLGALVGLLALAVRANPPALSFDSKLAFTALLALGAAAVAAFVAGVVLAAVSWAATRGRRFSLGSALGATVGSLFLALLLTAIAVLLFRHGDDVLATVREAALSRQWSWPSSAALLAFLPLVVPGVLLGALRLRRAVPLGGLGGYAIACAVFAPVAIATTLLALGIGFAAFDSTYFNALAR